MLRPNTSSSRAFGRSLFVVAAAAVAACGKDGTGPSVPTTLVFTAGQNQNGQVGATLPVKVIIEARNTRGPVAGIVIAVAVEQPGGGSVSPQSATTAADGTAQFTWTLGSKVGVQSLVASTPGQAPPLNASTSATASPGGATILLPNTETFQLVVVGHAVNTLPSVKVTDNFGNPIPGTAVTFEAVQGISVLTGASATADAAGNATLGGWTIGLDALVYSIRARIDNGAVAVFETRGVPASLTAVAGQSQSANAGTALPVLPAVRAARDDGSPLPNVPVSFSVIAGGGSVTGASAVTGSDGIARPTRWILGTTAGANRLEAFTVGRPLLQFDATGVLADPALVTASAGTALSGFFGNYVAASPEITVTDAQGNPVAGSAVNFQVTSGGGQVTGVAAQTDFLGRASVLSWRLGPADAQTLSATVGALPPVQFTATASTAPPSTFKIEVRYPATPPTVNQKAAFDAAAARWTQLIVAGGPPYLVFEDAGCGNIMGETVDGVVIFAKLENIDGPGNVLGAAGPCIMRDEGFLPAQGIMRFDTSDLPSLEASGQFQNVIVHEMAHVLGFGTLWHFDAGTLGGNAFLNGFPGGDPSFNGPAARVAFFGAVAPGTTFTGAAVPVEGSFGAGTRYSHWRESTFGNELMTGFLNSGGGGANPLSAITVQQFRDLGYQVNDALADSYTFQALIQGAGAQSLPLIEGVPPGLMIVINKRGRAVARIPRPLR